MFDDVHDEWICQICGLATDALTVRGAAPSEPVRTARGPKTLGRLEKVDKQTQRISGSESRMLDAEREVVRVADAVGCPVDIARQAAGILRQARKKGLTQGRSLDALAAASLQIACKMLYLTRPPQDMAEASRADAEEIQNAYKALVQGLNLPIPTMSANEYLAQVASKVQLEPRVVGIAQQKLSCICGTAKAAGKNPMGWAAAGLYLAAQEAGSPISVNKLAKALGISGSTVAARIEELEATTCN